jgi:hypothetical protein
MPTEVLGEEGEDADPTQSDGDIEPDVTSQMTPLKQHLQQQQQQNDETHVLQPEHKGVVEPDVTSQMTPLRQHSQQQQQQNDETHALQSKHKGNDSHKQQQQHDGEVEPAAAAAGTGPRKSVTPAKPARRSSSPHTAAAPAGPDEVTDQQKQEQQGGHQSPIPPHNAGGLSAGPGAAAGTEAAPDAGTMTVMVTPGAADGEQGQQQQEEVQGRGAALQGCSGAGAQQADRAASGGVSDGVLLPGVQPLAFQLGTLIDTTQAVSAEGCWTQFVRCR